MGDPAGIGPEIIVKAVLIPEVRSLCTPIVYGDISCMRGAADSMGLSVREVTADPDDNAEDSEGSIFVLQATDAGLYGMRLGEISAEAGKAAAQCVIAAATAALAGKIDAVVTAPLNKESMALGGYHYPGHTELLAEVAKTTRYGMLLLSGSLRVVHVSTHVSLREAIERVRTSRIVDCLRLGYRACRDLGIEAPHIAVAGLNPHAGEHGLFGSEETEEIAPAIALAASEGIDATGPYPPDTVFARASNGEFDLVVAMYHDQGHIPVKLHGFDTGVNVTIGLPLIRVSVDHGTAFDIAGTGIAREQSMVEAIRVAVRMVYAREAQNLSPSITAT